MAEPQNQSAIVQASDGGYAINIRRYDAAGQATPLVVRIPENASLPDIMKSPLLLAAALKDGDPTWQQYDLGFVLVAVMHAQSLGLDILQGDVYPVEGRIGISDWAVIKHARAQGRYRHEVKIEEGPTIEIPWETKRESGVWRGPGYTATVTVYERLADGTEVVATVYTTSLRVWFEGRSKEWRERPVESLRRKALRRAYQEVCPVGIEPDEAP